MKIAEGEGCSPASLRGLLRLQVMQVRRSPCRRWIHRKANEPVGEPELVKLPGKSSSAAGCSLVSP